MMLEKRSIRHSGRRTSLALEPLFWAELQHLAIVRGVSVPVLCALVDKARPKDGPAAQSLASALRCTILQHAIDAARKPASDETRTSMGECQNAPPNNPN